MQNTELEIYLKSLESSLNRLAPGERDAQVCEVRGHLESLIASCVAQGQTREKATQLALQQFGAPAKLGRELNAVAQRKRIGASARWVGKSFLTWSVLCGVNFLFYTSMNDKPTDFPFLLHDRLWQSLIVMTPAFLVGQIGGDLVEKTVRKWKSRRAAS